ncbi:MAG: helix-turn-helix transcriptional regulator [Pseudomonadota bacterium]
MEKEKLCILGLFQLHRVFRITNCLGFVNKDQENKMVAAVKASIVEGPIPAGRSGIINPIDEHVGYRVRMRRQILGISQGKLGAMLGITFQQVQKYEQGINRIGASRLYDISQVLRVPVEYFYDDIKKNIAEQSPRIRAGVASPEEDQQTNDNDDPMKREETLALVHAYYNIKNKVLREQVLNFCKTLARQ